MPRDKYFIIQSPEGEMQAVFDLSGYDGYEVLGEHVGPILDDHDWDLQAKVFKPNAAKAQTRRRQAQALNPHHILERIEALEAEIAILKKGTPNG